jgi:hypothetical protein
MVVDSTSGSLVFFSSKGKRAGGEPLLGRFYKDKTIQFLFDENLNNLNSQSVLQL